MIEEKVGQSEDIIGAKLKDCIIRDTEMLLRFDNGRTLTMHLNISVEETAIVPKAEIYYGYHNK